MVYHLPSLPHRSLSPSQKASAPWIPFSKKLRGPDTSHIVILGANSEFREQAMREARYSRSGTHDQWILEDI